MAIDRWHQCQGKRRFEGKAEARAALVATRGPDNKDKRVYCCQICGGWHYGLNRRARFRQAKAGASKGRTRR